MLKSKLRKIIAPPNIEFFIAIVIYFILFIISYDFCYFWDVQQQVSNEAHWYYLTNFSSLIIPANNELGIISTGYHMPLISMVTALLWKIFGYNLFISHIFMLVVAALLFFNTIKLIKRLFPSKFSGLVLLVSILEPTILTQFIISSTDFIIFTAFIMSLRAIFEKKKILLSLGLILICCTNMRGIFVGFALFISNLFFEYVTNKPYKFNFKLPLIKILLPYIPVLIILLSYYIYYFINFGWFFTNNNSSYSEHYKISNNFTILFRHFLSLILRLIESGRIIIWILSFYAMFLVLRQKIKISSEIKTLLLFSVLMFGLYFLFVFISQMPFSPRYFMPQFFTLTVFAIIVISKVFSKKKMFITFTFILFLECTGNFWVYPEKIAKPWDSMLCHIQYYDLRKDVFNYIEEQNINYNQIAGGFNFSGNRTYTELNHKNKIVKDNKDSVDYFIYSNISNIEDDKIDELKNPKIWTPIKYFEKKLIFVTIYKRL